MHQKEPTAQLCTCVQKLKTDKEQALWFPKLELRRPHL